MLLYDEIYAKKKYMNVRIVLPILVIIFFKHVFY